MPSAKPPIVPPPVGGEALRTDEPPTGAGRPVALTPEKRKVLLKALRLGGARDDAANRAGIGKSTLFRYLAEGRLQRKAARDADPEATPKPGSCWELLEAVDAAHSAFRMRFITRIEKCAKGAFEPKDIPPLIAALRLVFPDRYPVSSAHEITGAKGGPVKVEGQVKGVVVLPMLDEADADDEPKG